MIYLEHTLTTCVWNKYNIQIKHLQLAIWKHLLQLKTEIAEAFRVYSCNICVKHMQHPNKHTCNIRLKKQMKHLEHMLATYMYNHCNMCNITIYFCNIHMKHLQHTSETLKTYSCNMCFQRNNSLLLGIMEARWCVVFTGGSARLRL
jgi:hypothetical protein